MVEMPVFGVLGPVEVWADSRRFEVSAARQRGLLALLLADANEVLPVDRLVDDLWDGKPPPSARTSLQAYVYRLRRLLARAGGDPDLLRWAGTGYVLDAAGDSLDRDVFRRLVAEGGDLLARRDPAGCVRCWRSALGLWRGPAYADVPLRALEVEVRRLETERLTVLEKCLAVEVGMGRHAESIGELEALTAAHPLHEGLWATLMRALQGAGRQADALRAYTVARDRLVEELGIEPSPELQEAHRTILRGDRGGSAPISASARQPLAVPAQLPADVYGFAGRSEQLARLDALLASDEQPTAVVISAVSGTAGVGKTALAVHWAHRVRDQFPDGQLYVNLRGFDPTGQVMAPAEAVRGFLDALGVPAERIPPSLHAQTALYRSLLAGKRMLVVLDNARDAEQARPLLPGSPTALALVTSRRRLTGLVAAEGAHPLTLDLLTAGEARELLARRLGAGRIAAEPQAVKQIITVCEGLPLALTIAAARANQSGFPLAALAAELAEAGGRLDALTADDPVSEVRAVFSWSYTALTPGAARLFRLLGLQRGPEISAAAAASLAGLPRRQTRGLLAELTGASLVAERAPGRFAFHDLLRAYAADLAHTVDPDDQCRAGVGRLLDHYLHTGHAADRLLDPHRDPIGLPVPSPAPGVTPERLADLGQALAWLAAELPVLLAAVRQSVDGGFDTHTWQLAWALDTFLDRQGHWQGNAVTWQAALEAARRFGDPAAQALAHRRLARADTRLGRYQDAHTHHLHALDLSAQTGDRVGQAHAHQNLAFLWERQGQSDRALDHAQQALTPAGATPSSATTSRPSAIASRPSPCSGSSATAPPRPPPGTASATPSTISTTTPRPPAAIGMPWSCTEISATATTRPTS